MDVNGGAEQRSNVTTVVADVFQLVGDFDNDGRVTLADLDDFQ
jgi:hypothetical protein